MSAPAIGLVGCGRWGRNILRDLIQQGCRVAVATRSDESAAAARAGGACEVVRHAGDLPAALDGLVVATPTATHAEVVHSILDRGLPVYVEKPLAADLEQVRHIARLALGRVFVMHKWRFHPGVEALAAVARSAEFGAVRGLQTFRLGWGNPHRDVDAAWILLPHDMSIVLHVLGYVPGPVSARWDPLGKPGDGLAGELRGKNSLRVSVAVSSRHPENRRAVVLACERGSVAMTGSNDQTLAVRHADGSEEKRVLPVCAQPLYRELEAFTGHLRGGPPPLTGLEQELSIIETIVRLRELADISAAEP